MAWRSGPLAPARFTTARMLVRMWEPSDAEALSNAIIANLGHLRPWVDWARDEPKSIDSKRTLITRWQQDYLQGGAAYGLFSPDGTEVWGSIGYHHRIGEGAHEIGYWMRSDLCSQGLITEATGALTWIGFKLMRLLRVEIQCDPMNAASSRVPEKLGYTLHAILRQQVKDKKLPPRNTMVWAMEKSTFDLLVAKINAPTSIEGRTPDSFIAGALKV